MHAAICHGTGVEWDSWYVLEADASRAGIPRHAFRQGLADTAWALHRAHWLAGRYVLLAGAGAFNARADAGVERAQQARGTLTSHITQAILRYMKTTAPALLPIFRSRLQGELLAATLLEPEQAQSLTELARRLQANLATVQREVTRLERAGILRSYRVGNARLVGAETASPVYGPLAQLTLHAFGPAQVVAEEFLEIPGAREVYIFGSWAARYHEVEGPQPGDVDVLIVGSPNRDDVYLAALRAESRLRREVNTTIRSKTAWDSAEEGFVKQIRSSPLVPVRGARSSGARAR